MAWSSGSAVVGEWCASAWWTVLPSRAVREGSPVTSLLPSWPFGPAAPALADDEVHVWCAALEGRADTSPLLAALSEDERERLGRYRSRQAGNQFARGR